MGKETVHYGYIKDTELHEHLDTNVYWDFTRYNEDGSITNYKGIETSADYSEDSNIVMYEDAESFNRWANEFAPEME